MLVLSTLTLGWAAQAVADTTTTPPKVCAFWKGVTRAVTHSNGGNANLYLELQYDLVTSTARLVDHRTTTPVEKSKKLTPEAHRPLANGLATVCPTDAQIKAMCAPGGCLKLVLTRPDGFTEIQDHEVAGAVQKILASLFPELKGF